MVMTLRNTKGSPLTYSEADANFSGLADGSLISALPILSNSDGTALGDALVAVKLNATGSVARTQHDKNEDYVTLNDLVGVDSTGATQSTGAVNQAIANLPATGGIIRIAVPGTYLLDQIEMPQYPKNVTIECVPGVIFQPASANTPVFKGCASVTSIVGTGTYNILGFPIFKAHAAGSTGPALNLQKWSHSRFEIGGFQANASGKYTYGFLFDAAEHCYDNRIEPGMQIVNATPVSAALIRVENNANRHYVGQITAVATAMPMLFSFEDAGNISDWDIDRPYCEGWTATSPSVIDPGSGNLGIRVWSGYFEDVIKAYDETATSEVFLIGGHFAASPGVSQGSALGLNYKRLYNPTGGANTCNAIDTLNGLYLVGGGTIRRYDTGTGFMSDTFDGTKWSVNFPFQTTAATISSGMGTSGTVAPAITKANVNTTNVGNVGTGEDNLIVYNAMPANAMSANGKGVEITAWGTNANNANAKTLKLYFGAQVILTTSLTTNQAGFWRITANVIRTGSSTQDYTAQLLQGGTTTLIDVESGTSAITDTANIIIKCTGDATADNDIVQEGLLVKFLN